MNQCAWESSDNWRMSKRTPLKPLEKDWQNTLGTYSVSLLLTNTVKHFSLNCFNVIFCRGIYIFARLFQHEQRIRVLRDFEKSTNFAWSRLELYAVLVSSGNRRSQFSSGVFNNQWNQSLFVELRLLSRKSWTLDVCSLVTQLWRKAIPGQWILKITIWNH